MAVRRGQAQFLSHWKEPAIRSLAPTVAEATLLDRLCTRPAADAPAGETAGPIAVEDVFDFFGLPGGFLNYGVLQCQSRKHPAAAGGIRDSSKRFCPNRLSLPPRPGIARHRRLSIPSRSLLWFEQQSDSVREAANPPVAQFRPARKGSRAAGVGAISRIGSGDIHPEKFGVRVQRPGRVAILSGAAGNRENDRSAIV